MAADRIIGIDFGTSTSVIRVKRYEDGKPVGEKLETKEVIFSGIGSTVPTLIQKKDDDESIVYFGYEAQQKRKKTTTYHSFKVDLESSDPEKRALARKLTEEFFCYLAKTYKAQSEGGHLGEPGDKERTIVSYPVKWGEETRQFMVEAAQKAGFPNVTGMDEAQAAIQAVTVMSEDHLRKNGLLVNGKPSNILLIDMGAGTTDLVLCRYTPGEKAKAEILSTWPKDGEILFGGREVDSLLQEYFRNMMDAESANLVFRRVGLDKFKTWKENTVSPALRRNDSVTDFEPLDNQIEDNDIEIDEYRLDRAAFEKCLEEYLKQLPRLINGCIDNSKIKASDVDLVILTGGHSQWYFAQEMLTGKMPQFGKLELSNITEDINRIIQISRPQETVALGQVFDLVKVLFIDTLDDFIAQRHDVFNVSYTHYQQGKLHTLGVVLGNSIIREGQRFAAYNDEGVHLGSCTVRIYGNDIELRQATSKTENVEVILDQFNGVSNEDVEIDFLISEPVTEGTYDQAIAALENDGISITRVKYEHEDPEDGIEINDAYVFYVTEIKDGKIFGRSILGGMNSEHLEQYVYSKKSGNRMLLKWKNHTATGHNAFFEADCTNIQTGDIITDCILMSKYTFRCDQLSSWRYRLVFAENKNEKCSVNIEKEPVVHIIKNVMNSNPKFLNDFRTTYGNIDCDTIHVRKLVGNLHVPSTEMLILLYDDTVFGNGRVGFILTDKGIHTKSTVFSPKFFSWDYFSNASLLFDPMGGSPLINGSPISCGGEQYIRDFWKQLHDEIKSAN